MRASPTSSGGASGRAAVPGPAATAPSRNSGRASVPVTSPEGTPRYGRGPGGPRRPGGPGVGSGRRGPQPRWGRIALVAAAALALLGLLGAAGGWVYVHKLDGNMGRTDPFSQITGGRPAKTVDGSLNILLVGTDSRDPDADLSKPSEWRADTIIVMHIPANHDKAYLVSLPRDLYVSIPDSPQADCANAQRHKLNASFAFGGLPLAVKTVECLSDLRIDHVMAIDFAGFKEVTDALGGVDLNVERTIKSIHSPYRTYKKGVNHMNGAMALDYIRQRKQFPDGDFARMRHQQEFLKALMDKAASTGTLTNPGKLHNFLNAVTKAVTADESFSVVDMALQFRGLRGQNLQFLTSPIDGTDTVDGESVVISDKEKALSMFQAMANDKMADWVTANPPSGSGG